MGCVVTNIIDNNCVISIIYNYY